MSDECYNQAVYGTLGSRWKMSKNEKWNGKSQFPLTLKEVNSSKRFNNSINDAPKGLFNELTDPLLEQIFKYLPGHTLAQCELVCRDWFNSIQSNVLWRNACYNEVSMDQLIELTGTQTLAQLFLPQSKPLPSSDKFLRSTMTRMASRDQILNKRARFNIWNDNKAWKYYYLTWYSSRKMATQTNKPRSHLIPHSTRFIKNSGNDINGLNITASKFWAGTYVVTGHCNGDIAVWDISINPQLPVGCAFASLGSENFSRKSLSHPAAQVRAHKSAVTDIILYPCQSRGRENVLRFLTISYDNTMTICTLDEYRSPHALSPNQTNNSFDLTFAEPLDKPFLSPPTYGKGAETLVVVQVAGFLSAHSPETVSVWQNIVATDGPNNTVQVWRLSGHSHKNQSYKTGILQTHSLSPKVRLLYTMKGHPKRVLYLRIFDSILTSFSLQGDARVWNLKTGRCVQVINFGMPFDDAIFYFHLPPYTRLKNFVARGNLLVYLKEGALLISHGEKIHTKRLTGLGRNAEAVAISLWTNVLVLAVQSPTMVKIYFLHFDPSSFKQSFATIPTKVEGYHNCEYLNITNHVCIYSYKIVSPSDNVQFIEISNGQKRELCNTIDYEQIAHTLLITTHRKLHAIKFKRRPQIKHVQEPVIGINLKSPFKIISTVDDTDNSHTQPRKSFLKTSFVSLVRESSNQIMNRLVTCGKSNTTS